MSDDIHEVYAICYGSHERRSTDNFIMSDDPHELMSSIAYYVWVIVGPHGTFVVDTGFDAPVAKERGRKIIHPIAEGLQAIGIDPSKVGNVIVSHLHWDHSGNYATFPNARYHLQDIEMAYATGRYMCHGLQRMPFGVEDVCAMVRKVFAGRVTFHDGASEIAPGITVHHVGGHSKGLMSVRVKTRRGYVMVTSDAVHLYRHIDEGKVFPITFCVGDALEGYEKVKRLATSRNHIVPGHDPLVLDLYPAAKPGLEKWVVKLDVEPKILNT